MPRGSGSANCSGPCLRRVRVIAVRDRQSRDANEARISVRRDMSNEFCIFLRPAQWAFVAVVIICSGCADESRPAGPGVYDRSSEPESGPESEGRDAGAQVAGDLPCELAAMLESRCWSCHGATPVGGAPMSLVSHADLTRGSFRDPGSSFAERAVVRMRDPSAPMPPGAPRPESEITILESWIALGMQAGECGGSTPMDAGAPMDAGPLDLSGDLPCEITATLANRCWSCHGAVPAGGAPMSLISRADLIQVSTRDPTLRVAERAVLRMRATSGPMPPSGARVPESEIAALDSWIALGMPAVTCGTEPPPDPFDTPVQCTSARTWPARGDEGPEMHPGRACISCHTAERDGPSLWLGGTVYPTAHEPDDCFGTAGATGAVVEITDASGRVFRLVPNATGNFLLENASERNDDYEAPYTRAFEYPYRARVLFEGRERVMGTPQMTGDCNSCHTVSGANGAPGRILLP